MRYSQLCAVKSKHSPVPPAFAERERATAQAGAHPRPAIQMVFPEATVREALSMRVPPMETHPPFLEAPEHPRGPVPREPNPCLVLSQKDRRAPAARKRALSVPVSACTSQLIAQTCSSGAQSQFSPFCAQTPCPYWVIFPAIQFAGRNAEITSHTSCVLPMLRVCPPTTITRHRASEFLSFAAKLVLYSFDARGQLREPAIPCEKLFEFRQRTSRCSPNRLAAANGFSSEDAALPADYCTVLEFAPLAKA